MKPHGVFWCRYRGYRCPAKAPVTELQRDLGYLDHAFWELVDAVLR